MILLKPFASHIKTRKKEYSQNRSSLFRDLSIGVLLFVFSSLIYLTSRWILKEIGKDSTIALPPELPLIFSFNIFLPMIFFTALSGALSHFFYSEDLELLLASPIKRIKFFLQKYLIVALETSWMSIIALLPFLLSFTSVYHVSSMYYLLLPIYIILFVLIPSGLAIVFGILWALIIPLIPSFIFISIAIITGTYFLYEFLNLLTYYLQNTTTINPDIILSGFSKISNFGSTWSPATWLAKGLAPFMNTQEEPQLLEHSELFFIFGYTVLATISLLLLSLSSAYILFLLFYRKALGLVWGKQKKILRLKNENSPKLVNKVQLPNSLRHFYGLIKKELVEFYRDPSQLVQTFFLLSIVGFYLYILKFQQNIYPLMKGMSPEIWSRVLLFIHLLLECFITVAMATRLLFPSISREGRSVWILQCSPVTSQKIILSKYLFWAVPITLLISLLSGVSFYLQFQSVQISMIKLLISASMVASITALAINLGARFSNFSWESRSQLIASFGSLIFMVSALLLSAITIIVSLPLFLSILSIKTITLSHLLLGALILTINGYTTIFLLKKAGLTLSKKLHAHEG